MLLEDLQTIIKVAELHSITAAATQLDTSTATASAAVKRVEKNLGIELFIRTTRHLRLSEAGERYIPQCKQALLTLEQAKQQIKSDLDIVDGELRIALSSDLGRNLIAPWLDDFLDNYPEVSVRLSLSDSKMDFFRDSIDMALRYGSPDSAQLYGLKSVMSHESFAHRRNISINMGPLNTHMTCQLITAYYTNLTMLCSMFGDSYRKTLSIKLKCTAIVQPMMVIS